LPISKIKSTNIIRPLTLVLPDLQYLVNRVRARVTCAEKFPATDAGASLEGAADPDDRRLRDKTDYAHPNCRTGRSEVDLVNAMDEPCPRLPALHEAGVFGLLGCQGEPPMRVRVGAVVLNELGAPLQDVRCQAGDPFEGIVLAVAFGYRLVPGIGHGHIGEVNPDFFDVLSWFNGAGRLSGPRNSLI